MARTLLTLCLASVISVSASANSSEPKEQFYGTQSPYSAEAVYFLLTDRFVDGDSSNNHEAQGGDFPTFNRPLPGPDGQSANVGYLGGDFQGILDNAQYIKDMGFTSIWATPIFDQPDEAFSGGEPVTYGAYYKDGGKTGYHGYWGVNFFEVDEHLPSENLTFKDLTRRLREDYDLRYVLDIVANHGSPSYTMPEDQPKFGEIFDKQGTLIADHQNLHPTELDDNNPLHDFFNRHTGLAQLSDLNENKDEVLDYFTEAYLFWLEQGVHALRVDTIKEMPHFFWKKLFDNIREKHPDIFIFGESYSYDAAFIAEHTYPENGGVSVLDFPGREAITGVFESADSSYSDILAYLHLEDGVYANSYELMTFYDNHDMTRMNSTDAGFINANNWLFTSRGIPVIYYGSEINFMTGKPEHEGNRNYLGQERIDKAVSHPIHQNLTRIANVRKSTPALQRGLQANETFTQHTATFYRVVQDEKETQTALVILNKSDEEATVTSKWLSKGTWREVFSGQELVVENTDQKFESKVAANNVQIWLSGTAVTNPELLAKLKDLQANRLRKPQ